MLARDVERRDPTVARVELRAGGDEARRLDVAILGGDVQRRVFAKSRLPTSAFASISMRAESACFAAAG